MSAICPRCTAKSKRTHNQCQRPAMRGRTTCYHHGGSERYGIASPFYKHGRYSRYGHDIPLRLAAALERTLTDPEIHSIQHEVAVAQVRLQELLRRDETGDLGHAWLDLDAALTAFDAAERAGDVGAMRLALEEMRTQTRRGKQDYLLWQEILSTNTTVANLRIKEHKRLVDLELLMTAQDAEQLFGGLQIDVRTAILKHAPPEMARTILLDIQEGLRVRYAHALPAGGDSL